MIRQALVVGLDGADWRVLRPLLERGRLPNLQGLLERGAHGVLESIYPPVTFPAWNTFFTGVAPSTHGVLDFTRWHPGEYRVSFTPGGVRRVPTVFEHLAAAGRRVAVVSFPGTYPPPALPDGFVLSGFDAPVAMGPGPDFARPRELYERVVRQHGRWVYADIDELQVAPGWHRAALGRLLAGLERKRRLARALVAEGPWDLFAVHIGETDTVGHHFWAFHDPDSPRRPADVAPEDAEAVERVYCEADGFIGTLLDACEPGASVLVASDHGMQGASDRVLHLNRALAQMGLLRFAPVEGRASALVGRVRDAALRHLPGRVKEALFRRLGTLPSQLETDRRLGGIDFARTAAFSEELTYAPSIRLNIRGRDPAGMIRSEDAEVITRAIESGLRALRDPNTGEAWVRGLRRRDEVHRGPARDEAPDLYVDVASPGGYPITVLPARGPGPWFRTLLGDERAGGKGRGPVGVHHRDGVIVLAAPGAHGDLGRVPIGSCAATMMAMCGLSAPDDLEYPGLIDVPGPRPALRVVGGARPTAYTPDEERRVAQRLRGLGYLD